ncbi:MAG: penicillin-binding protein [Bacteroidota bacterium]
MNIKNEVLIRVYVVLLFLVLIAVVIFFQAFKISFKEGKRWRDAGKEEYLRYVTISGERGNIMTEDGSLLATSLPFFEIWFDPNSTAMKAEDFENNVDSLAWCLATYVDNTYTPGGYRDHLLRLRESGARHVLIKKGVSYAELKQIKKFPLFRKGKYRGGLIVERTPRRDRPFGLLAQRTIGYVRESAKPVGLEGYFDKVLGGQKGKRPMERVAKNTWIPVNDLTEIEPENGHDIITTIDINLQDIAEGALYKAIKHHNAKKGTAVIMEVETGAIRAIANLGRLKDGQLWETYNYAIGEAVEPGSTYKLASIMAMLEDDYIRLDDSIDLEQGSHQFYEEIMLDAAYHQLDTTTIRHAFEISSNVGIAKLAEQFYAENAEQFIDRLKGMNLHLPVGIEIEGEAPPYIKEAYSEKDEWSGITVPWMSIGYEVLITPLQMLTFFNAVANNGQMMKPYLVSEVQHFGKTVEKIKPTVVKKQIASTKTIRQVQDLLAGVVSNGTASKYQSSQYNFAGKTGTAQVDYRKFKPRKNIKHRASFVGYFPAEAPVYSCIVMITEPKQNGIYGSEVALPVFREIADRCYESKIMLHEALNRRPQPELKEYKMPVRNAGAYTDMEEILAFLDLKYEDNATGKWVVTSAQSDTLLLQNRSLQSNVVPNVVGMGLRDALYILENLGLQVVLNGAGKVVKQSLIPGTRVKGQTIRLTLR